MNQIASTLLVFVARATSNDLLREQQPVSSRTDAVAGEAGKLAITRGVRRSGDFNRRDLVRRSACS
jgi:hypothetical protein